MYHFEGEPQPRTPEEDEREFERGKLDANYQTLRAFSPEALTVVMALERTPQLSSKEFEAEIADYNREHEGGAPAEGKSEDFTVTIAPGKRSIIVRMFENGRVQLIAREGTIH
jgi:hypothetical protein